MIHFLSLIFLSFTIISAAPAIVYETQDEGTDYVTSYAAGATEGASDVGYTTLYSNAVSWTSTLWPGSSTSSDYSTVLPSTTTTAAAAAATEDTTTSAAAAAAATTSTTEAAAAAATTSSTEAAVAAAAATTTSAAAAAATTSSTTSYPASTSTDEDAGVVTIISTNVQTIVGGSTVSTAASTTSAAASTTSAAASTTKTTSSSSSTTSSTSTSVSGPQVTTKPKYVVYSPYNSDSTCKDSDTVYSDLQSLQSKGVNRIRVYATDCNSLYTVQPAAAELGIRIVQGLWIGTAGTSNAISQLDDLITAADGDWSIYDSIVVGNEDVTNGYISASDLLSTVKTVRSTLNSNGFYGNVIAAETTTAYINNPDEMCDSSYPFLALNAHSYFASSFSAQEAGTFVQDQISIVAAKCSRSDIWISETGYPWKGDTNGLNVPTKQNQADAVNAILDTLSQDCVILAQYDDMWKDPGTYGVEQYFGVLDITV